MQNKNSKKEIVKMLLKKDIMLDKKYLLITVFIAFGIPIFIAKSLSGVNIPGGTGFIGLLLSSFYGYFMMFSKIEDNVLEITKYGNECEFL